MLAQSFLSADELHVTEQVRDALIKTLVLLETGKLKHVPIDDDDETCIFKTGDTFTGHFNMSYDNMAHDCGTVCCIRGTTELVAGIDINDIENDENIDENGLMELFYPVINGSYNDITTEQAAIALRGWLNTGKTDWSHVE